MFEMTFGGLLIAGVAIIALVRGGAYISGRWDKTLQDRSEKRQSRNVLHN